MIIFNLNFKKCKIRILYSIYLSKDIIYILLIYRQKSVDAKSVHYILSWFNKNYIFESVFFIDLSLFFAVGIHTKKSYLVIFYLPIFYPWNNTKVSIPTYFNLQYFCSENYKICIKKFRFSSWNISAFFIFMRLYYTNMVFLPI